MMTWGWNVYMGCVCTEAVNHCSPAVLGRMTVYLRLDVFLEGRGEFGGRLSVSGWPGRFDPWISLNRTAKGDTLGWFVEGFTHEVQKIKRNGLQLSCFIFWYWEVKIKTDEFRTDRTYDSADDTMRSRLCSRSPGFNINIGLQALT